VVAAGSIGLFAKLAPQRVVSIAPVQLDWRVLAFTLAATVATGILFGLAPAITAARGDVNEPLRSGGTGGSTARSSRLRAALVVAEVALALVLVTGAGLTLKSFAKLVSTDVGINTANVVMGKVTLPQARYEKQEQRLDFYQRVLARLAADPAVASSGVSMAIPLTTESNVGFTLKVDGSERDLAGGGANAGWTKDIEMIIDGQIFASVLSVSPGYLRTLGIPVLSGRDLLPSDRAGSHVAVVNERFAKAFWPATGALGKRVYPFGDTIPYTIVGVVGDVRNYSLQNKPGLVIYRSIAESAPNYATFVARGNGDARALLARVRDAVWSVDRQQAVFELEPVSNVVAQSVAPQRTSTTLIVLFGAIALLLSAVGVYAVIAFGVSQRTREIGIRIALGAGSRQVVRLVLREGLVLALVGATIGAAGAFALTRLMKSLLYEVSAADPLVFAGSTALLVAVAMVAALVPARRAARVDPVTAIRTE
jgi:putative ABC transport system permease protein